MWCKHCLFIFNNNCIIFLLFVFLKKFPDPSKWKVLPVLEKGGNGAYLLTCLVTVHTEAAKVTGKDIQYMTPTHIPPPPCFSGNDKNDCYVISILCKWETMYKLGEGWSVGWDDFKTGAGSYVRYCTCTPNSFLFKIF